MLPAPSLDLPLGETSRYLLSETVDEVLGEDGF